MGRECGKCEKFKKWSEFHKKKNGQNGYDSRCKKCRKLERAKRNKLMKSKNKIVIDYEEMTIESEVVGKLDRKTIDEVSMIVAHSYKNRGFQNG